MEKPKILLPGESIGHTSQVIDHNAFDAFLGCFR